MTLDPKSSKIIIFGGVLNGEESAEIFILDLSAKTFEEVQEYNRNISVSNLETSLFQNIIKNLLPKEELLKDSKIEKSSTKRAFEGFDRKEYEREYIIKDERLKAKYRRISEPARKIRNAFISLGVCENDEEVQEILGDSIPKSLRTFISKCHRIGTKKGTRRVVKPVEREGHTMVLVNDLFILFGGMKHVMSLNDLYMIDASYFRD